jgi:hypothetical protein
MGIQNKNSSPYSIDHIKKELDEGKENRGAEYGIFVVKDIELIQSTIGWFNEYNESNLVCALGKGENENAAHEEILCIAYKWAKLKLTLESQKGKKIDSTFISQQVKAVKDKLKALDMVLTQCNNIGESAGEIRSSTKNAKGDIDTELIK